MFRIIVGSFLASAACTAASAATLTTDTTASVLVNTTNGSFIEQDDDTASSPSTFVSSNASVGASGNISTSSASATASANTVTGELKAAVATDHQTVAGAGGGASGIASASISETFILNGSGSLSASMLFDLNWAVSGSWQAQAKVSFDNIFSDTLVLNGSNSGQTGSIDDYALSFSQSYTNVENLSVSVIWSIFVQDLGSANSGSSLLDASNTGTIWYQTSAELSASPQDDQFLSAAVYPEDLADAGTPVVPLPEAGWLLAAGLAALLGLRRGSGA